MYLVLEAISSLKKGADYDPGVLYMGIDILDHPILATISDKVAQLERNSWPPPPFFTKYSGKFRLL